MMDDLIMAHDNLQRELAHYKSMVSMDKHELIKSNISKIRKIEELENELKQAHTSNEIYKKQMQDMQRKIVGQRRTIGRMKRGKKRTQEYIEELKRGRFEHE